MKKVFVVIAIVVVAAACGGGAVSTAGSSLERNQNAPSQPKAGQGSGSAPAPGGTTDGGSATVPSTTVPVLQGPPVIRQAQLAITVGSGAFDSKLAAVRALVEAEGGYIAGTDAQAKPTADGDTGQIRTGVINFMVPASNFDTTIDQLSGVGKVQSVHISGTDVSAQYVDLRARLANAQAQLNAMRALLTQAKSINDIIAVQNQIGQITAQIEQLEGQIKYLDDNTSYSSVSVTLTEAGAPVATPATDSWGFVTALNAAAHNFVTTINYVIAALGAAGPLVVLALLAFIFWRRRGGPLPRRA